MGKGRVVRHWAVASNDYYGFACYQLEEKRLATHLLEEGNWTLCSLVPRIPLPTRHLRGEYGDLSGLWHSTVCVPVFEFCEARTRHLSLATMPLEEMKERHPEAFEDTSFALEPEERCQDLSEREKWLQRSRESDGQVLGNL